MTIHLYPATARAIVTGFDYDRDNAVVQDLKTWFGEGFRVLVFSERYNVVVHDG